MIFRPVGQERHCFLVVVLQWRYETVANTGRQRWARYFCKVPAVPALGTLLKVPAGTRYLKLKVTRYFCRYFLKKVPKRKYCPIFC